MDIMDNNAWNVNKPEFQGYVKAKLEDISKGLEENWNQTGKNTKDISTMKGWVAAIGAVAGIVGGFIGRFFK